MGVALVLLIEFAHKISFEFLLVIEFVVSFTIILLLLIVEFELLFISVFITTSDSNLTEVKMESIC